MIFLLLTFLFFSQFHAGCSVKEDPKITNFFNKFIKAIVDRDGHLSHNGNLKDMSVADAAKLLELGENVAQQILSSSNLTILNGNNGKWLLENVI